jgi:peptidoglycan/LPS O-acetylase OafA/YrhL
VFFTLSGYLITGVLLRDLEVGGRIRWVRFYLHRGIRLLPALFLFVLVWAIVTTTWTALNDAASVPPSVLVALTYLSDLPLPFGYSSAVGHLWTLAVEEQFYLVWPALLALTFLLRLRPLIVAIVLAVGLTVICWLTLAASTAPADIYKNPTTWASTLVIGGIAYMLRDRVRALIGRAALPAALVAIVVLLGMSITPGAKDLASTYLAWPTIIAVATALVINFASARPGVTPVLQPLRLLGVISYAAYLWDLPMWVWAGTAFGDSGWAPIASIVGAIAAATISWFTVEAAGRALRRRLDARYPRSAVPSSAR